MISTIIVEPHDLLTWSMKTVRRENPFGLEMFRPAYCLEIGGRTFLSEDFGVTWYDEADLEPVRIVLPRVIEE